MTVLEKLPVSLKADEEFIRYVQALCEKGVLDMAFNSATHLAELDWTVEDISGNINRVRRVQAKGDESSTFSVIVKTVPAGGVLEKFPDIQFPVNRLAYEATYAQWVAEAAQTLPDLKSWVPRLLHQAPEQETLLLEDLAPFLSLQSYLLEAPLKSAPIPLSFYQKTGERLALFHRWGRDYFTASLNSNWEPNPSAKANRPYVLTQPFNDELAMRENWLKNNQDKEAELQKNFLAEYKKYLYPKADALLQGFADSDWAVLTHGDLHGDSLFVRGGGTPTLIDAELCDWGGAWFDLGMLTAHLWMLQATQSVVIPVPDLLESYWRRFTEASPALARSSVRRTEFFRKTGQLAGFEIIRRIVGAAPCSYLGDLSQKEQLLESAAQRILKESKLIDAEHFEAVF